MIMDSCIMESISKKRKLQVSRINGDEEQQEEEEEKEIDKFYALIKRMREARDRLISASENPDHHDHHDDHASKTKALHDHNNIQLLRKRKIKAMGVNEEVLEKQRPSTVVSTWKPTFQREDFIDHHHHHHHQADQDQDRDRVRLCSGGFNIAPTILGLTLGLATSSSTLVNMSVAAADQTRRDGRGKATEAGLDLTLSL